MSRFHREQVITTSDTATVSAARDDVTGNQVRLIEFHPEQIVDRSIERSFTARFDREAGILAAITDRHVLRIIGWGNEHHRPYLAVESVPGRTLAETIESRGLIAPRDAVVIIEQVLSGLRAIHAAGLLHLKLTPETIHLGDDGIARISDTGLASLSAVTPITDPGERLNVERYQAPEQLDNGEVSEATDIYAVGAIFYEMLTGQAAFPGANPVLVRFAQLQSAPPAPSRLLSRGIPRDIDSIVTQALAKHPLDRFDDVHALRFALDAIDWRGIDQPDAIVSGQEQKVRTELVHSGARDIAFPSQPTVITSVAGQHRLPTSIPGVRRSAGLSKRSRESGSNWILPMVIAGLVIAVLIAGLVRSLTGEQPMEAVAGVSVLETEVTTSTPTVTVSPTARVVRAAKKETSSEPTATAKAKATKTPKPTRTPKPNDG